MGVAKGSPTVAVGVDALGSPNGTFHSDELIGGVNTEARMKSTVVMAVAKLAFPRGTFRPYLFAGLGGHSSSLFLSGQPQAGVAWANGGSDTRVLVDEHKTSVAIGYGIGLDAFLNENFFLGLELRGTQLGGLRTRPTAAATAAGFTMEDKGPVEQGNILFRLGWKFGQ